jgi:hypothetical protein
LFPLITVAVTCGAAGIALVDDADANKALRELAREEVDIVAADVGAEMLEFVVAAEPIGWLAEAEAFVPPACAGVDEALALFMAPELLPGLAPPPPPEPAWGGGTVFGVVASGVSNDDA